MKKILKFLIFLAVGLVVFFVVMQKVGLHNIKQALSLLFSLEGLVILFLTFLFALLGVVKWRIILKEQGHIFSLKELSPLWLLGFGMSYLTPFSLFGGEIFRMYFTKKKFPHLKWKTPMASVACDKLLDATVFFIFLVIGLIAFTFYGRLSTSSITIGVLVIAGGLFALLALFYFKRYREESILEWLINLIGMKKTKIANSNTGDSAIFQAEKEVFKFFDFKKKAFWHALSFTFLRYILHFIRACFLLFFLVGNVSVLKSLAVYGFANLSTLTPMPATLGALELGEGIAFRALGFGFGTGTVFSMVWRGADLFLCFFGFLFLVIYSVKLAEEKVLKFFSKH